MKSEEELFDDTIRRKLSESEVAPPTGMFDTIIPNENKKRGFLWFWVSGIVILLISAISVYRYSNKISETDTTKNEKNKVSALINEESPSKNITSETKKTTVDTFPSTLELSSKIKSANSTTEKATSMEMNSNPAAAITASINGKSKQPKDRQVAANFAKSTKSKSENAGINYSTEKGYLDRFKSQKNNDYYLYPTPLLQYNETQITKPFTRLIQPTKLEFEPRELSKFSIEVNFLKSYADLKKEITTKDTLAIRLFNEQQAASTSIQGYQSGLKLLYTLNKNITVGAGISYSKVKEEFSFQFTEYYKQLNIDTVQYYILFPFSPPIQITEYDSTLITKTNNLLIQQTHTYETFYFNTDIRYTLPVGRFTAEPQLGVSAALYNKIKGSTNYTSNFEELQGGSVFNKSAEVTISGVLQIGYSINEKLSLFAHSGYSYSLNPMKTSALFYTQKTNKLMVGAGVKINFLKSRQQK
ncbi:MAG: autotransporter outer membrane beta-barrel domain-containing protein [Bacteroidetes bacterium]|nr:autotransporter outer membrane beta-barrel domain-containing protein [Bacteroidota bacterium]